MRLILGLVVLLLAEVGLRAMDSSLAPLPAELPERPLKSVPKQLNGWDSQDLPLDPAILKQSGAATMLDRMYSNPIGDEIAISLGIWTDVESGIPHSPELCYPGAGWDIVNRKAVTVEGKGLSVPALLLKLEKSGERILVLYWYQCGNRSLSRPEDLRVIRQSLRGSQNEMPPVVKAMLQSGNRNQDVGEQQLMSLASSLLPELAPYTH